MLGGAGGGARYRGGGGWAGGGGGACFRVGPEAGAGWPVAGGAVRRTVATFGGPGVHARWRPGWLAIPTRPCPYGPIRSRATPRRPAGRVRVGRRRGHGAGRRCRARLPTSRPTAVRRSHVLCGGGAAGRCPGRRRPWLGRVRVSLSVPPPRGSVCRSRRTRCRRRCGRPVATRPR